MDPMMLLHARAAALRTGLEKEAISLNLRSRAAAENLKRWLTGRKFTDLARGPRPAFPAVNGETAVAQEAEALAQQASRTGLLRDLHDTPYFHLKDRIAGGVAGAPLGYAVDNAIGYGDDSNPVSNATRRMLAIGGGAYMGGRGLNALMNTGRQYLANTTHLYGYGAANVKLPKSWQELKRFPRQFWEHGVMNRPSESAFLKKGPAAGAMDPRHELFRRYLGVHSDNAAKDIFVRRADGTLGFNPQVVNKNSPYWKHYVEPMMNDERFAALFHWKPEGPMKLTDLSPAQRARVERRLGAIREAQRKADEARRAAEEAAKREAERPRLILSGQPQGQQPRSLILPGMERQEAREAPRLFVPGESHAQPTPAPAPQPSQPPPSQPPQVVINERGETPWWQRPGRFVHDRHSQPKAPRYESDATRNPLRTIFGSHDTRDVPRLTRDTLGGHYQKGIELGDLWDFKPASWERDEFMTYLRGLRRTSPQNWRRYLFQEATHAHPDSVVGKQPLVGPRMASYGMRQTAERLFGKEAPVVRQRMLLDYRAPAVRNMEGQTVDRLYQGPTSAHLVNDVPLAPRSGAPESVRNLRTQALVGTGALGVTSVPAYMNFGPRRPGETEMAQTQPPSQSPSQPQPQPQAPLSPVALAQAHAALPGSAREVTRARLVDKAKNALGGFWNRMMSRYGGEA